MRQILYGILYVEIYICAGIALFSFIVGIWGLFAKRPFLISIKWTLVAIVLCLLPQITNSFSYSRLIGSNFEVSPICGVMILSILIYTFLVSRHAYIAYGITEETLKKAILHVLKEGHLDYQESRNVIKVPSLSAELKINVQDWMGVGQVRMKFPQGGPWNARIVHGINLYFQRSEIYIKKAVFIFFITVGAFMVSVPAYCLIFLKHLPK